MAEAEEILQISATQVTVPDMREYVKFIIQMGRKYCNWDYIANDIQVHHHFLPRDYVIFTCDSITRGCQSVWGFAHNSVESWKDPVHTTSQLAVGVGKTKQPLLQVLGWLNTKYTMQLQ